MGNDCCAPEVDQGGVAWKRALKIALILNLLMFFVEVVASISSSSMSLQADALDFLGDTFNYGVSLYVVSSTLKRRATVSILKGMTMLGFGMFILVQVVIKVRLHEIPTPPVMGIVGFLALVVNFGVAVILYKFREGDSNMQSVWLCTRNDVIGNTMVLVAALLVQLTQSGWPDWITGSILAVLAISSGTKVVKLARQELAT